MNPQVKRLARQAGFKPDNLVSRWDEEFEKFTMRILDECILAIKRESFRQLDPEFGIIYARAIAAQLGYAAELPFLTVTPRNQNDRT